jgi:hypothetical protein
MAKAVKSGGMLIITHMLGSHEWLAGEGTHFPAVSLTIDQVRQAYLDADLEILALAPVSEDSEKKARPGYHGMVLVVAQPKMAKQT